MKTSLDAHDHMICGTLAGESTDRLSLVRLPSIRLTLWKLAAGRPEWVLTFSGDVDMPMLDEVLQQVERVTSCIGGTWHLELFASGLDPADTRRLTDGLYALLRFDVRHELILIPRRACSGPPRVLH